MVDISGTLVLIRYFHLKQFLFCEEDHEAKSNNLQEGHVVLQLRPW